MFGQNLGKDLGNLIRFCRKVPCFQGTFLTTTICAK